MDTFLQDIRFGIRQLRSKPAFTAVAVVALALGIGANTAIFSVVNSVLLRPMGFKQPDRLVIINHVYSKWGTVHPVGGAGFLDYTNQSTVFEQTAASTSWGANLTEQDAPERLQGQRVTASYFPTLGVEPSLGRTFTDDEDQAGKNYVVVLSHKLWQRRFNSDPNILGQTMTLNGFKFTVIGVMPASFNLSSDVELWTPMAFTPQALAPDRRSVEYLTMIARLKPGVTYAQAQGEMDAIARHIVGEEAWVNNLNWSIGVKPLFEQVVGKIRPALLVLLGAVGCVLLIACANVANLLLARATARRKEIAVRTALGASRRRIIMQLLTESTMLAIWGGLVGLLLAWWGVDLMVTLNRENIPRWQEIGIDARVLGFTFAISLATGLLFGLVPALQASKADLTEALKETGRSSAEGFRLFSFRNLLIVVEVALALVLLICAGLLTRSFTRLVEANPGYETRNVLTMQVALPRYRYDNPQKLAAFYKQAIDEIRSIPGVRTVGMVSELPLSGSESSSIFRIEGYDPAEHGGASPHAEIRCVSPDYFQALGIPLLAGRYLTDRDTMETTPVTVIDEALARQYWPDENPIGKRLTFQGGGAKPLWREVVGVVASVRHKALDADYKGQFYYTFDQFPYLNNMFLAIRTETEPMSLANAARDAIQRVDKDQPVYQVATMEKRFGDSLAQRRFLMTLLGVFAVTAMILAAVGLYGVMSYSVTQRTHEIGIRMALGARPADVLRLVVGQGMILVVIGVAAGVAASVALTRLMASLLYSVSATDPLTFVVISVILTGVALAANFVPARRATRVDPMVALRYE